MKSILIGVCGWIAAVTLATAGPIPLYAPATTPYAGNEQILGTQPPVTGRTVNFTPAGLAAYTQANPPSQAAATLGGGELIGGTQSGAPVNITPAQIAAYTNTAIPPLPQVANTAALQAANTALGTVQRLGFATPGDAPPLAFTWHATWSGTPDNLGYVVAPGGAGSCSSGCWVANGAANDFDILEFAGNAASDYGAPCTTAISLLPAAVGGRLTLPAGRTYPFTTSCNLGTTLTDGSITTIEMQGAKLTTTSAIHIFDRSPSNNTVANNIVGAQFYFDGGLCVGNNSAGQECMHIGATYGTMVRQTFFESFDVPFECQFCLKAYLYGGRSYNSNTYGPLLTYGSWIGATPNNSGSNASSVVSWRDYAKTGQTAQFAAIASDGVRFEDIIAEGQNPISEFYWSDGGATTVKSVIIDNVHSENTPSQAILSLAGNGGGSYELGHVFAQYNAPILDTTGLTTGASTIHIHDIPASPWGSSVLFTGNGPAGTLWFVENFVQNIDLTATSRWSTGTVPALLDVGRWSAGGAGIQFSSLALGSPSLTTSLLQIFATMRFTTDDTYNIGTNATTQRPHSVFAGTGGMSSYGGYSSSGAAGVSCSGSPTSSFASTGGIVTHC